MVKTVVFSKTDEQFKEYAARGIKNRIDAGELTELDAQQIREFVSVLKATENISSSRAYKITNSLSCAARFFKVPLCQNSISDIYEGVANLKSGKRILAHHMTREGTLSQNTLHDYWKTLRRFYLWLVDEKYCTSIQKEKLLKIKPPSPKKVTKTPDMLLTEEDICKIVQACSSVRDKALISTLYESGCRIHEIGCLKWKDISFDKHFAKLCTDGKTGKERFIPLVSSREYLAEWKNMYLQFGTPSNDMPVFVTDAGKSFSYQYLRNLIIKLAKAGGVEKKITPHIFRHSRITNLIRQGLPQQTLSLMMWGSVTSEMLGTYLHLASIDVEREIAKLAGIDVSEGKQDGQTFKPKLCPRCLRTCTPDLNFCPTCGAPLSHDAAMDLESLKEELHQDERYTQILADLQNRLNVLESMQQH